MSSCESLDAGTASQDGEHKDETSTKSAPSSVPASRASSGSTRRARRVRFYRNGDRFYAGCVVPVLEERYRSFESLVADLTRVLLAKTTQPLPSGGVRALYALEGGRRVTRLDELEDGKAYVCAGNGEPYKRLHYADNGASTTTTPVNNNRSSRLFVDSPLASNNGSAKASPAATDISVVRPRIVTLIRNGIKPRKVMRLLLNKRNAPSFEHALTAITECVKLDAGCVRRVFAASGRPVLSLDGFFGAEDVFFAYGNERHAPEDFELEPDERKAIHHYKKPLSVRNGVRNGPKPKMPVKAGKAQRKSENGEAENAAPSVDVEGLLLPEPLKSNYSIGKFIGDGNFSIVRVCQHRETGQQFALKIIDKAKCRGKEHYLVTEVRVMRQLCHPRVVSLVAEQDTSDWLYLVIELVRGGDLFDSIAASYKFTEDRAQLMIGHLASAMAYLHGRGIVHRDIKPENLLVEIEGDEIIGLKLGDFGLACEVQFGQPLYTVCGTPTYIAPEILLETGYGFKIDVWAAGVILYILLCGFPPFVAPDGEQDALFDAILDGRYDFPSPHWCSVSRGARDLVTNMLQKSPILRFSAEDVLDHPWLTGSYLDGQDTDDSAQEDENGSF